jgi:hypothetical protein
MGRRAGREQEANGQTGQDRSRLRAGMVEWAIHAVWTQMPCLPVRNQHNAMFPRGGHAHSSSQTTTLLPIALIDSINHRSTAPVAIQPTSRFCRSRVGSRDFDTSNSALFLLFLLIVNELSYFLPGYKAVNCIPTTLPMPICRAMSNELQASIILDISTLPVHTHRHHDNSKVASASSLFFHASFATSGKPLRH